MFSRAPASFQSYGGYATGRLIEIRGRVLRMREHGGPAAPASRWRTLLKTLKLFLSREVADATVEFEIDGEAHRAVSDDEGYVCIQVPRPSGVVGPWLELPARMVDAGRYAVSNDTVNCRVRVPGGGAEFGVVSDIDDTILRTEVERRWRMVWRSLSHDVYRREAIDGAPALYREIERGSVPFFYLSNSPWNLYPVLLRFLDHSDFPDGPLLLRDFGWNGRDERKAHKLDSLRSLLGNYRRLRFLLIGDSGEKDAQIYAQAAEEFPGRVTAVVIRRAGRRDDEAIDAARRSLGRQQIPFHVVDSFDELRRTGAVPEWESGS